MLQLATKPKRNAWDQLETVGSVHVPLCVPQLDHVG